MVEIVEAWLDKSGWGSGAWQNEPDRVEWRDKVTGLPCLALRHSLGGHWCGYVGVPPGHPWYDLDFESLPSEAHQPHEITFAGRCMEDSRPQRERVCHVALPGEPDAVFWLGFDFAHYRDLVPAVTAELAALDMAISGQSYKHLAYVQQCCADLAEVAVAAGSGS